MLRLILVGVVVLGLAGSASAQVFYEPVQYQHGTENNRYYYGGNNAAMHARAEALVGQRGYGQTGGYAFASGSIHTHREVSSGPARIYSDRLPTLNARVYGYTEADAYNAAQANSPTYFRKADLLLTAELRADGTWIVPNAPIPPSGLIVIRKMPPATTQPTTRPATQPKPVLIIPRRLLDQPLYPRENPQA